MPVIDLIINQKAGKLSSLSSPSLTGNSPLTAKLQPCDLEKGVKKPPKEVTKEGGLPFQCTLCIMALGNLPGVHQSLVLIQNAQCPLPVTHLFF